MSGAVPTSTTGSFRFDPPGSPLRSSQQLNLDFSKFENHTFFSSAATNVNIAFEKIINLFPFDGTKSEYEDWLDDLTGFEKHILDNYPKYTGYLTFKGDSKFIEVKDKAGVIFPSISRRNDGNTVLNPTTNPLFVEVDVAIPNAASEKQFLFHHVSPENVGYAAYFDSSTLADKNVNLNFVIVSGSLRVSTKTEIQKGKFSHLGFAYDPSLGVKKAFIYNNASVVASSQRAAFASVNTSGNSLIIGSGSAVGSFVPTATLSGSIDNFRVFHEIRDASQRERFIKRDVFAEENLKLNLRFNEATGSYRNNDTVLDHSGNSLHSRISNYDQVIRAEKPYASLNTFSVSNVSPTLFPGHPDVLNLNENLLLSASQYDENNPNLITKLIPKHYLEVARASMASTGDSLEGSTYDGIMNADSATFSAPGGAKIGQPQIISALLFIWARTFDELKMMVDHVSELVHVDYESGDGISEQMLPFLSEYYGFELPNFFRNANYDQFFSGEEVFSTPTSGLKDLQNQIWRRILTNMRDVISSKGTKYSIKSLFRSSGIDPDRVFRFVEHGGSHKLHLGNNRRRITEISTLADFSGSLTFSPTAPTDAQGFSSKPNIIGTYLSSSRIEVGTPSPAGTFVRKDLFKPHGVSNNENDGLLTSGSWTLEGRFKFPLARDYTSAQSIFRLHVTGSTATHGVVLNLVADPSIDEDVDNQKLTLYCRPGFKSTDKTLSLVLTGANIFDGNKWYVSVGRQRNDEIKSELSSSYFINLGRQEFGEILEFHTTSSLFLESDMTAAGEIPNAFQQKDNPTGPVTQNASGSFMVVGNQTLDTTKNYFLNHSAAPAKARTTRFSGKAGHYRFWSKALTSKEVKEHARSFLSLGVEDPLVNFGFNTEVTGSFERLRMDVSTDQPITGSDSSGNISLVDFSQQNLLSGTINKNEPRIRGAEANKQIIKPERFDFSIISPIFDEVVEDNKVRVTAFAQPANIEEFNSMVAPVHRLPPDLKPQDDVRFSIEFSVVQALNEDIMKIFATLESLERVIGGPENMYATEYQGLRRLREIYFNRLEGNVNYTAFFEFFRWLDESFDVLVEELIPKKTNYLGFNMVVEPHALERARVAYGSGDVYLGENNRRNLKGVILLRQLIATIKRY